MQLSIASLMGRRGGECNSPTPWTAVDPINPASFFTKSPMLIHELPAKYTVTPSPIAPLLPVVDCVSNTLAVSLLA
jgi:hypothetical protein